MYVPFLNLHIQIAKRMIRVERQMLEYRVNKFSKLEFQIFDII